MTKHTDFRHQSQHDRLSLAEQIARACATGTTGIEEEEGDMSFIFQPPHRSPETD